MDEFIGIIKLFAGTYAPQGWAFCEGQQLSIRGNEALYAILGNTYGGDAHATFALPDLRGRVPAGAANSATSTGQSHYALGEVQGHDQVSLTPSHLPAHTHSLSVSSKPATTAVPAAGAALAQIGQKVGLSFTPSLGYNTAVPDTALHLQSVGATGQGTPLDVRQPLLALNYIICIYGVFPPRS